MTPPDPLNIDPFADPDPHKRIDHLFHLRRATHRCIIRYGEALWASEHALAGRLNAPPAIAALPADRQPRALAADEAARFAKANVYGLDEAVTTAAVTLGSQMVSYTSRNAAKDTYRGLTPIAEPPTQAGLLRWANGIGYDGLGVPLIACHWGSIPDGIWMAWWADNRVAVGDDILQRRRPRYQALNVLREFGPLAPTRFATTITPRLPTDPSGEEPADDLPLSQNVPPLLALTATVLASWALLTTRGATGLIKHPPTLRQASLDRRAGLPPTSATLATEPVDEQVIERLVGKGRP
ncbi:hypothetical protein [Spirillospora albida]|uniref:hypothetical protein n=1 Tax=Spirillospora albida TaxID=58123 RepID=UPI0004C15416|nr:hypothetical protein [Spirillospora albida]